jgi:O-antigen ligase
MVAFLGPACAILALAIWEVAPQAGGWPLCIAFLPWFVRLAGKKFPFQRTPLDVPVFIFLLTALVGLWAAYDLPAALAKFWLVVGGIFLFYALAGLPQSSLQAAAVWIAGLGPAVAGFFLLTNDWVQNPAKTGFLNQIGVELMRIRPALGLASLEHNEVAGVVAITAPFLLAAGLGGWRTRPVPGNILFVLVACFDIFGFLLAISWGTVLAMVGGLASWLLYPHLKKWSSRLAPRWQGWIFGGLVLLFIAGAGLFYDSYQSTASLEAVSQSDSSFLSRLDLDHDTIKLAQDYPFTGSGLASFSGQFSGYTEGLPVLFVDSSHNHYLQIGLEQGLGGLAAFFLIYLGSFWLLWKTPAAQNSRLVQACQASLIILCLLGLADNIIYMGEAVALVIFIPGLACAAGRSPDGKPAWPRPFAWSNFRRLQTRRTQLVGGGILLLLVGLAWISRLPLAAAWYSNLGALQMAQVDLAGFPSGLWRDAGPLPALQPARALFLQAVQLDPANRTANHRLGLIALQELDFRGAVAYLEAAYRADPNHRGIWKSLGYAYAWNGQPDLAVPLLEKISEAQKEMGYYAAYWQNQGQAELARKAQAMELKLAGH